LVLVFCCFFAAGIGILLVFCWYSVGILLVLVCYWYSAAIVQAFWWHTSTSKMPTEYQQNTNRIPIPAAKKQQNTSTNRVLVEYLFDYTGQNLEYLERKPSER
jgi:hypothetical protein